MSASPSQIVIPVVAGIGNALLAVPMVRAMKRARPEARITILARIDAIGEVFRRLPEVDEVIVTGKGIKGLWRMVRASRERRPDVYLVPFPSNRWQYAMLALTSGASRRILHGYPIGYWRAMHFIGQRVPAQKGLHDVEQNLRLLSALDPVRSDVGSASADRLFGSVDGLIAGSDCREGNNRSAEADPTKTYRQVSSEAPTFALTAEDRAGGDELLRAAGFDPANRPIVIHAGSARTILAQAKRWPAVSYAHLILALIREVQQPICLVEGPDEVGVTDEILGHLRSIMADAPEPRVRVVRLTGSLGTAAAVLERASLYVGSDSGLAHLAAAVGTPPVTLFAPADPQRVCPFGYRDLVVQAPSPCAPCFEYPWNATRPRMRCRDPLCITRITVGMVLDAVHRAQASREKTAPEAASACEFANPPAASAQPQAENHNQVQESGA